MINSDIIWKCFIANSLLLNLVRLCVAMDPKKGGYQCSVALTLCPLVQKVKSLSKSCQLKKVKRCSMIKSYNHVRSQRCFDVFTTSITLCAY